MNCKGAAAGVGLRAVFCILALAVSGSFSFCAAQSSPPADSSKDPKPAATSQEAVQDGKKTESAKLQKMVDEHRVITNEDLERPHVVTGEKYAIEQVRKTPPANPAVCDEECAKEARDRLGMDSSQEGEWQTQLAAARHYLATDADWRDAYTNGFQRVQTYCTFQRQLRTSASPSGDDFHSRYERAKREQYAEEMGRTLSNGVQSASERLNRMIEKAENADPVRAAVMSVLAGRALNQCANVIDP